MQFLDNDIDQLCRRAAGDYPLKTDSANWSRLQEALQAEVVLTRLEEERKSNPYRRLLWLLLLIPVVFICNKAEIKNGLPSSAKGTNAKTETTKTGHSKEKVSTTTLSASFPKVKDASTKQLERKQEKSLAKNNNNNETRHGINSAGSLPGEPDHHKAVANLNPRITGHTGKRSNNSKIGSSQPPHLRHVVVGTSPGNDINNESLFTEDETEVIIPAFAEPVLEESEEALVTITDDTKPNITKVASLPPAIKTGGKKKLYAGIVFAPDVTTVRLQKIRNIGFNAGLLVGYNINKKFAIEAGLLWEKKFYYTNGKHYNLKDYQLPDYTTLEDVDGYCQMWEIPVTVKYTFSSSKKIDWFANAGLSTFLMQREKYKMNYLYDWQPYGTYYYSYDYDNPKPPTYLFSVLHLSAGFTKPLGKVGFLRVEPYFKMPLGAIGSGDLKIASAGLQVGLTRALF